MTTVAPPPPPAADAAAAAASAADHIFMIEEVPARSTEVPAPATETQQPSLIEVQQPLAEVTPAADESPIPVTTKSIISLPATEEEAKREDLPVPAAETTAAAATEAAAPGDEAVAALRDVPTPSVDFGLIQEVTGVLREEPASSWSPAFFTSSWPPSRPAFMTSRWCQLDKLTLFCLAQRKKSKADLSSACCQPWLRQKIEETVDHGCCHLALLPTMITPSWGNCRAWLLPSGPAANHDYAKSRQLSIMADAIWPILPTMTTPSRGNCLSQLLPSGPVANHDYAKSRQLSIMAAAIWPCCQSWLRQVEATVKHGCCHLALLPTMTTLSLGNCRAWLQPSGPAAIHDYAKSRQLSSMDAVIWPMLLTEAIFTKVNARKSKPFR